MFGTHVFRFGVIALVLFNVNKLYSAADELLAKDAQKNLTVLVCASRISLTSDEQNYEVNGNFAMGRPLEVDSMTHFLQGSSKQSLKIVRDYFVSSLQDQRPEIPRDVLEDRFAIVLHGALQGQAGLEVLGSFFKGLLFLRQVYQELDPKPNIVEFTTIVKQDLNKTQDQVFADVAEHKEIYSDLKVKLDAFQFPLSAQEIKETLV